MFTLFDFVSHANGMLYALTILFVAGFIVFWEVMKPKPFKAFAESLAEDVRFIRGRGMASNMALVRNVALAPVVAAMYFAALPLMFTQGLWNAFTSMAGALSSAGWNPVEAYLAGRKQAKKREPKDTEKAGKSQ